jgi:hypothetical protein
MLIYNHNRVTGRAIAGVTAYSAVLADFDAGTRMSEQDQAETRLEYARLKIEHADFDAAIAAMQAVGCDLIRIQRMKKKKLAIKDRLQRLESKIIPDIIA